MGSANVLSLLLPLQGDLIWSLSLSSKPSLSSLRPQSFPVTQSGLCSEPVSAQSRVLVHPWALIPGFILLWSGSQFPFSVPLVGKQPLGELYPWDTVLVPSFGWQSCAFLGLPLFLSPLSPLLSALPGTSGSVDSVPVCGSCSLSLCFLFLVDSVSCFRSWKSLFLPFLHTGGVFPFNPGIFLLKNHQPSRNPLFLAVASCGILSSISLYLLHFLQPIASILFISLSFCEDWYPGGFSVIPTLLPALFPRDWGGCP